MNDSVNAAGTAVPAENKSNIAGIVAALVAMVVIILLPTPETLGVIGQRTAALFIGALILWATEALPIAVTSLLVLILQPLLDITPLGPALVNFMSPVFFFVLTMFIIALAWVKTGLARRFAWWMLSKAGTDSRRVIYVFVLGAGMLSMIVSDVPAAAIFMAIALGIFSKLGLEPGSQFGKAVMLGIPIGALIGGVGTPAGSSINLFGLEIIVQNGGDRIPFVYWMAIGIPMVAILLPLTAWVLIRCFPPEIKSIGLVEDINAERARIGRLSASEWKLIAIISVMGILWILSSWPALFPAVLAPLSNVFLVAILGSIVMFLPGIKLFSWAEAQQAIGWEVLMLIGAVTSLGALSQGSGLAQWLVDTILSDLVNWNTASILLLISTFTVVIHLMLPINPVIPVVMIPPLMLLADAAGLNPALFALPVIFTASCAFLLPLDAVPLVTYGKGYYKMFDMLPAGSIISVVWVLLMTALLFVIGPVIGIL
jgi:sodium-dependent dicarboxylate transporter 2/3/5